MNELTTTRQIAVTEDQKQLVKSIVFPGCSDDEMRLYLFECERRGVHPLDRLIFPIKRADGEGGKRTTFQCSVDYLRAEAADTGEYDGQDEPEFGPDSTEGHPLWASVAVYKKGLSRPIKGTARWSEFYPGEKTGFMWRKMPFHMLAKCAEVLALRKAFPKRLAGLYVPEEMQAPDGQEKKPPLSSTVKKKEPEKKAAKEKTVNDTLADELAAYCPDEALRLALLKQISAFTNDKKETVFATDISKMSNKWAGTALGKLREMAKKKDGGDLPANCPKNPKECEHSGFVDGKAQCGPDGVACLFGEVKG
ncbi:MAG: recombinase RecT [Pseudomonadota bacterium]